MRHDAWTDSFRAIQQKRLQGTRATRARSRRGGLEVAIPETESEAALPTGSEQTDEV